MFKPFVLVFISVSLCLTAISAAPAASSIDDHNKLTGQHLLNETTNAPTTTSLATTTTITEPTTTTSVTTTPFVTTATTELSTTELTKLAEQEEAGSSHSLSKEKTVANFAQYNGKLLVNQSAESSMNGRIISQQSNNNNNNNNVNAVATSGLSLTVILVLIAVVTMVVSGIILSALFVMRRRFSIWRLNGDSNEESKEIPASSADNQPAETTNNKEAAEPASKEELKCDEVNEKDPELAKQVSTLSATAAVTAAPVDTPVNINCDNGHSNEAATDLCGNEKLADQQQASPSSSSPLIEKAADEQLPSGQEEPNQPETELKEQVTSSSSLIVNVLNELSESVACKLATPGSPAAPDSATCDDAETQPLNKEE